MPDTTKTAPVKAPKGTPEPAPAPVNAARDYHVLMLTPEEAFRMLGTYAATTTKGAIEQACAALKKGERDGTFVAVPCRNWSQMKRRTAVIEKSEWS